MDALGRSIADKIGAAQADSLLEHKADASQVALALALTPTLMPPHPNLDPDSDPRYRSSLPRATR